MSKRCQEIFSSAFGKITDEIEYNRNWSNGAGFHDYAVYGENAIVLHSGQVVKSISPGGRRLIFIGSLLGSIVVFDRYGDQINTDEQAFFHNCTSAFDDGRWVSHGPLYEEDLNILLGDDGDIKHNIGWRIDQIYQMCKKVKK